MTDRQIGLVRQIGPHRNGRPFGRRESQTRALPRRRSRRFRRTIAGVIDVAVTVVLVGVWAFAVFDAITADPREVRRLPKFAWVVLVLLLSDLGAVAWLVLGRPRRQEVAADAPRRPRVLGPEDAPDFEERIRRVMRPPGNDGSGS